MGKKMFGKKFPESIRKSVNQFFSLFFMETLNIILHRVRSSCYGLDGKITIDGIKICDTVENRNIHLKAGTYIIKFERCEQHKRKMPVVILHKEKSCTKCTLKDFVSINTPMPCLCPQITVGNGMHNRKDCAIIVGKRLCAGVLIHTVEAFHELYEYILKYSKANSEIELTVVDIENNIFSNSYENDKRDNITL